MWSCCGSRLRPTCFVPVNNIHHHLLTRKIYNFRFSFWLLHKFWERNKLKRNDLWKIVNVVHKNDISNSDLGQSADTDEYALQAVRQHIESVCSQGNGLYCPNVNQRVTLYHHDIAPNSMPWFYTRPQVTLQMLLQVSSFSTAFPEIIPSLLFFYQIWIQPGTVFILTITRVYVTRV